MKCTNFSSKGFSLVELMIVLVIVGILAAVTIPAYFNHILRTRQSDTYHNLLDLKAAQEMVYSLENKYAPNPNPYPATPNALHTYSDTLTKMLNFDFEDTKYYMYYITSTTNPIAHRALAEGKLSKLYGNKICVGDDYDPCMVTGTGSLKQSLGLQNCPAAAVPPWPAPLEVCP
jgi:prepilin-type N-terminal cleavage/methylation domain-containing protein